MAETIDPLVLDLLEWVALKDRSYAETMEAWRTSCPKLPVWETATDRGLISVECQQAELAVRVTAAGFALLQHARPSLATQSPTPSD